MESVELEAQIFGAGDFYSLEALRRRAPDSDVSQMQVVRVQQQPPQAMLAAGAAHHVGGEPFLYFPNTVC